MVGSTTTNKKYYSIKIRPSTLCITSSFISRRAPTTIHHHYLFRPPYNLHSRNGPTTATPSLCTRTTILPSLSPSLINILLLHAITYFPGCIFWLIVKSRDGCRVSYSSESSSSKLGFISYYYHFTLH